MSPDSSKTPHRCGHVALIGQPNVGKSTQLNALIGAHLSIVSRKPQTTRHRILGIVTKPGGQTLYVDTPGMHRDGKRAINRQLNRAARQAIGEVDVAVHVIEAGRWADEDQLVLDAIKAGGKPAILAINKVDTLKDKTVLLPFLEQMSRAHDWAAVMLVSAKRRDGLEALERVLLEHLPDAEAAFGEDEMTDRSERFLAAELVREQLMRHLGAELPYATTVEIEEYNERPDGMCEIGAVIWVERTGQKAIVIGASGERLKEIGTAARIGIEKLIERRVFLRLWVKVRENWSDDDAALRRF